MSSYLVSDKTINQIVGFIDMLRSFTGDSSDLFPNDNTELGSSLLRLNHLALQCRYNDPMPESIEYTYEPIDCELPQRMEALRCWLYQCSEGDVPGIELFKVMSGVAEKFDSCMKEARGF